MARVYLEHIEKNFGSTRVVKDLTLEIKDEEFVVLVGPSGCGKTTTLRLIAGLEEVTAGRIYIGDRLVNDVAPKDRDIAMVFQNYALYPHMNVFENMAFGLKLRRLPRAEVERRVRAAAERLGIVHLLSRRPRELSGGQRQRVALGRAVVRQPQVFLMDEPLSNLDARLRVDMRAELARLHRELKATIVYVTHDQVEAMTMGDRIVVMKDGVVQQVAAPRAVYEHPANVFVAGFIGSPPMNFFTAAVTSGRHLAFAGGRARFGLTEAQATALAGREQVILGIRPEDLRAEADFVTAHPETALEATVEVVEPLGAETLVHFSLDGAQLVARLGAAAALRAGERLHLAVAPERLHFFDVETEKALP